MCLGILQKRDNVFSVEEHGYPFMKTEQILSRQEHSEEECNWMSFNRNISHQLSPQQVSKNNNALIFHIYGTRSKTTRQSYKSECITNNSHYTQSAYSCERQWPWKDISGREYQYHWDQKKKGDQCPMTRSLSCFWRMIVILWLWKPLLCRLTISMSLLLFAHPSNFASKI